MLPPADFFECTQQSGESQNDQKRSREARQVRLLAMVQKVAEADQKDQGQYRDAAPFDDPVLSGHTPQQIRLARVMGGDQDDHDCGERHHEIGSLSGAPNQDHNPISSPAAIV